MKYTVRWNKKAQDRVIRRWLDAESNDRAVITAACNAIDAKLRNSPGELGESRGDPRVVVEPPLILLFKVSADDRMVDVLDAYVRLAAH